jgi:hypothetical protein
MVGMTFQEKAIVHALRHSAYALGCLAQGDSDAAELHRIAAQKYADVACSAQAAVAAAAHPWLVQALLDAHQWDDDG